MFQLRSTTRTALLASLAALVAIGCGGGGGGGSHGGRTPLTTGGSSGGGTTGTPVTTNGGSTGDTTGGETSTDGGTTGSANGGSTSAGTTGDATTGSTTGSEPTTGGSTAGNSTTGGSIPGGSTGVVSGLLRPNAIYFGHMYGNVGLTSIFENGSGREDVEGLDANAVCVAPDPDRANGLYYAAPANADGSGRRLVRGPSLTSATPIAPDVFDDVTMLQPIGDGIVVAVASTNGRSVLLRVENGVAHVVDDALEATATPDGGLVAYITPGGELKLWDGASTRTLNAGGSILNPALSRDGAWVAFSSDRGAGDGLPFDLYRVSTSTGAVVRITNTPDVAEFGPSFNGDGTAVACVGMGMSESTSGIYVVRGNARTRIAPDSDTPFATYWASAQGRSLRAKGFRSARLRKTQ